MKGMNTYSFLVSAVARSKEATPVQRTDVSASTDQRLNAPIQSIGWMRVCAGGGHHAAQGNKWLAASVTFSFSPASTGENAA